MPRRKPQLAVDAMSVPALHARMGVQLMRLDQALTFGRLKEARGILSNCQDIERELRLRGDQLVLLGCDESRRKPRSPLDPS